MTQPTKKVAALLAPAPVATPKQAEQMPPAFVLATVDQDAIISVMPATGRDLVAVLGFTATLEVLRKFGGKRVFVPSKLTPDSKLIAELGRDVAEKLSDAMPGSRLEPPMLASVERLLRDNAIRSDFDSGNYTMDDLVDRYRVTGRHLRKVLKASPSTSPKQRPQQRRDIYTMDLFNAAQQGAYA